MDVEAKPAAACQGSQAVPEAHAVNERMCETGNTFI